jgi:hypothetical protein
MEKPMPIVDENDRHRPSDYSVEVQSIPLTGPSRSIAAGCDVKQIGSRSARSSLGLSQEAQHESRSQQ